jgi:hypothetical protein
MIASQYKIELKDDYDMDIIEERIRENGHKTDGFRGLYAKFYLMSRKSSQSDTKNTYCPLYLWKEQEGLNAFLFKGYYDNILRSFGWQKVNIGLPLLKNFKENLYKSKYVLEQTYDIEKCQSLNGLTDQIDKKLLSCLFENYVMLYNPDKWKYVVFYFSEERLPVEKYDGKIYEIKHISFG